MTYQTVKRLSITLAPELLGQVDARAKSDFATRSDIIRQALLQYLRASQVPLTDRAAETPVEPDQEQAEDLSKVWAQHPYVQEGDVALLRFLQEQGQATAED